MLDRIEPRLQVVAGALRGAELPSFATVPHAADSVPSIDRELSLIEFFRRVLEEAHDEHHPLLERVKFLAILGTNIEEFIARRDTDRRRPVHSAIERLTRDADEHIRRRLAPMLAAVGIHLPASEKRCRPCLSVSLEGLWQVSRLDRQELRDPPLCPRLPVRMSPRTDVFEAIRRGDILLHHPYESFEPVIELIQRAAVDPNVLSVSITMYRLDRDSRIGDALVEAVRRGKQVRAVVELNARHDEWNNALWARTLAEAGVHVVHGIAGVKVHAKLALIVRREGPEIRRYVHVSTGNYHAGTSTAYTDIGLLTCDAAIGADVTAVFNILTGRSELSTFRKLIVAPFTMRRRLGELIEREIDHSRRGEHGHLILKMNALIDREIIQLLQRASQSGVRVDLIVRGICCLRPGVPGVTDHVRVRSIVGRFLEHSRVWHFRNGGREEAYIGSADLRPRNLDRRVEVMVPLSDDVLVRRVRDEILAVYLADNVKARELSRDGSYVRALRRPGQREVSSQVVLAAGAD